jgi:hypothetical protein
MSLNFNQRYLIQGNAGNTPNPYIKVNEDGHLVVGQEDRPVNTQEDFLDYIFKLEDDPNRAPDTGNMGLFSEGRQKYVNLFEENDSFIVTALSDEINGYSISSNGEYYNVVFSSFTDVDQKIEYQLMSIQSTDENTPVMDLEAASEDEKNEPAQKWVFTEVPPDEIEDIVLNPNLGV